MSNETRNDEATSSRERPAPLAADVIEDEGSPTLHEQRLTPTSDVLRSTPHEHEHEHEHAHEHEPLIPSEAVPLQGSFPHAKLDAYRVALEMAALAKKIGEEIPRGHRSLADHMLRAATNAVLLLAEGANRRGRPEKSQRFGESRGECAEVAAAADLLLVLGIGERAEAERLRHMASRVSAMLTRLIARLK